MSVKLLTEHHFEILSLKGGCTGSSKSTLVKMSHCRKSHVAAQCLKHLEGYIKTSGSSAAIKFGLFCSIDLC